MVATLTVQVLFPDGETIASNTATGVLRKMLGGWNPSTLEELRLVLCRRANIPAPTDDEDDLSFLYRLDAATLLCVQITTDDLISN